MYIYDLVITRGEDVSIPIEFSNVDLSGKVAQAQIRPNPGSETLSAEFTCSIDYSTGTLSLVLTPEQTLAMTAGTYAWDVALVGDGFVRYYIGGKVTVRERVTEVS